MITRNPLFKVVFHTKRFGRFEVPRGESLAEKQVLSFMTSRRIGNAAGQFSMDLTEEAVQGGLLGLLGIVGEIPGQLIRQLTWYDILSTMDYVELWAWSPPEVPDRPLMRGFIDDIQREWSISGDQPQRVIRVRGRDFGKISLMTKLYYVNKDYAVTAIVLEKWRQGIEKIFAWKGGTYPPVVKPPFKEGEDSGLNFSPALLVGTIWETFCKPQLDGVRFSFPNGSLIPECKMAPWVDSWEKNLSTLDPRSVQHNVQPWSDMWAIMTQYSHAPWREMWIGEEPEGPRLFYRPTPWLDKDGGWAQENPETWVYPGEVPFSVRPYDLPRLRFLDVTADDIAHFSMGRTEADLRNFFITYADNFGAFAQYAKDLGHPLEGHGDEAGQFRTNPYLVGAAGTGGNASQKESDYRRFGFRIMEVRTKYFSPAYGPNEQRVIKDLGFLRQQGVVGNLRLVRAYDHQDLLEQGSVVVRGRDIRAGDYVRLPDLRSPDRLPSLYYVDGISHSYEYGTRPQSGKWITSLQVTRGRGHLERMIDGGVLL